MDNFISRSGGPVIVPIISVIMPCYNHAAFIEESIVSILNQSFEDFELIITDDCSIDGSIDIIRNYAKKDSRVVSIFHEINGGEAKSRNDALKISRGDYIGFCDSDDLWEKDKLLKQINYLNRHPEINAVHSDSIIIDETSKPTGEIFSTCFKKEKVLEGNLFLKLCLRNFINVPTVLLRKKCIGDAGLFEQEFLYLTDWIYWAKVAKINKFGYINEPLARYRVHSGSTMHDNSRYPIYRVMGYKLLLERFNDIPGNIKTIMEYLIGVNHLALNNKSDAKMYFRKAIKTQPWNLKGISRYILSYFA